VDASITQKVVAVAAEATEVTTSAAGARVMAPIAVAAVIPTAAEATNMATTGMGSTVRITAATAVAGDRERVLTGSTGALATARSGWLSSKPT